MKRYTDPSELLHVLLDRHERSTSGSRRITAYPSQAFASQMARDHLIEALTGARDAGAVAVDWDRDAPHLVARVVLTDAVVLYRHLGRMPLAEQSAAGVAALDDFEPSTDVGRDLWQAFRVKWQAGQSCFGIAPGATEDALQLVRVADAAFTVFDSGAMPLRTRSARLLGDSKAIERSLSKLLAFMKTSGRLLPDLTRDESLDFLGLAKFPQPVLIAGPVTVHGSSAADLAYIGVPPEALANAALAGNIRSVLTIENLESFHRHVREARGSDDVVVYCGGFPAQGVIRALRHIAASADVVCIHHWGDIDPGGVRIARFIETSLAVPVVPHLMSAKLAQSHGRKKPATPVLKSFPESSSFAPLASFLASSGACWLEQEILDPAPL